ncbi:MAG: DUF4266 domain-containing protein [Myxococcota bacterium]|nr:DUF4266 domain-containing protein [Myxococcota bacterium]
MRFAFLLAAAGLIAGSLAGCATVAPYQREYLSRAAMDFGREDSETAFRAHVHDSREGATGGHGSTGGGCGCN